MIGEIGLKDKLKELDEEGKPFLNSNVDFSGSSSNEEHKSKNIAFFSILF